MKEVWREQLGARLKPLLARLYGEPAGSECLAAVLQLAESYLDRLRRKRPSGWNQRDIVLICYGDHVRSDDASPLHALRRFLADYQLRELISTVHLLPFFPYSSDDGFAVIDYRQVNPALGTWDDIRALAAEYHLAVDLVLNHVSSRSEWFQAYREGREPYVGYFIEVDPDTDLSKVRRPRATPLLTPVQTSRGLRHVWTTFSADQIDLDYANPRVLLEMLEVLLFYVSQGARIIRLDAIAYLWKRIGTECVHLPETHAVVKLVRALLDAVAPGTLVLTETNVPHEENVSYFGDGDEAHIVYQFSMPPLVLEAILRGEADALSRWADAANDLPRGCTVLNITATHDGIGVLGLEGWVPPERVERLYEAVRERGGLISCRKQPDGSEAPYELNITYFSALDDPRGLPGDLHVRRFITSQAIMLAFRGIPAIYFSSLFGAENWQEGVERTGQARSINRRKYERAELDAMLREPSNPHAAVFNAYRGLLQLRTNSPAFHPDAPQEVLQLDPRLFALARTSLDGSQRLICIHNVSRHSLEVDLSDHMHGSALRDLFTGFELPRTTVRLLPYNSVWLEERL